MLGEMGEVTKHRRLAMEEHRVPVNVGRDESNEDLQNLAKSCGGITI